MSTPDSAYITGAAAAEQMQRLLQVVHQRVDAGRIAPDQHRRDQRVERRLRGGRDTVAEGLAPADDALVRLEPQQQHVQARGRAPAIDCSPPLVRYGMVSRIDSTAVIFMRKPAAARTSD